MPLTVDPSSSSSSTRSSGGVSNGTAPRASGSSRCPEARGSTALSATNATSPRCGSCSRRCWASRWEVTWACRARASRFSYRSARSTTPGSTSVSSRCAAWPLMRRPAAGRAISQRTSTYASAAAGSGTTTDERSRISWPVLWMEIPPESLPPRGPSSRAARENCRVRKSPAATRRSFEAISPLGIPVLRRGSRTRARDGGAYGSD